MFQQGRHTQCVFVKLYLPAQKNDAAVGYG
jgi:hypothetical protein